jgi:hypothetical protein
LVDGGFGVPVNCRNAFFGVVFELHVYANATDVTTSIHGRWAPSCCSGVFPDLVLALPSISSCYCSHPHPWLAQCHLLVRARLSAPMHLVS